MKYIAIDKIKGEFTEDSEPRDDYFIELLKKYIKEEIDPIPAILALKDIVPFSSEYKPETSPEFQYFGERLRVSNGSRLNVYFKDGKFVMSDDYNSYYLYQDFGFTKVPCNIQANLILEDHFKIFGDTPTSGTTFDDALQVNQDWR